VPIDKAFYVRGRFLTGDSYPAVTEGLDPVRYGCPPKPNLAEVARRLDEARKRLDEIARAVRR
jgi:hypothetical protein